MPARLLMPAVARRLIVVTFVAFLVALLLARTSSSPAEAAGGGPSIWLTQEEIDSLPMSGPGWDNVFSAAQENTGNPDFSDQGHDTDVNLMAKALVYARTGETRYRDEAIDTIMASIDTEGGATALAVARNTTATVVAADLVRLSEFPSKDAEFRDWIDQLRTTDLSGRTLIGTHEKRGNNWGTHAGSSRIAIDLYLGDTADLAEAARVFQGWLGNRDVYADFKWGDLSWQCDPDKPVGINPVGCEIEGHNVDGVVPDDQRRGGDFQWPPPKENYAWGGLQGAVAQAYMLSRVGYDAWNWEDQAVRRAVFWLHEYAEFPAAGDDEWQPWMVNWAYGTNFPAPSPAGPGKLVGWTDWTHADADPPSTNQYVLSVNIEGSGSINLNPPGGIYDDGTVVTLEAVADSGWTFAGWSGDLSGTTNPDSVRMSRNRSVTATFVQDGPAQHTLTVNTTGSGVVRLDPDGGVYDDGTVVTLEAIPDPGWVFAGWGGELTGNANPESLRMSRDRSVTATFVQDSPTQQFTLNVATTGSGSVELNPPGGQYDNGTLVTLQASPDPGWIFAGWGGDLSGSANPATLLMDANKSVLATFVQPSPGGGNVRHEETVTGGSSYSGSVSTSAPVTAVAGDLYIAAISTKAYREVTAVSGLGLNWTNKWAQCSGRNATGVEIWYALGAPDGDGVVSATLSGSAPREAVIAVSRYSGVDSSVPIGAFTSANTNGYGGACADGSDSDSYSVNLSIGSSNAVLYSAAAIRGRSHSPGAGFTELVEISGVAGIAAQERNLSSPESANADGSFDRTVDWSVIALEIRAGDGGNGSTQHSLSVNTSGSGGVSLNPPGGWYDAGTVVTLEAFPADGWKFTGWSGDLGGAANPTTLTMDANKNVTANFEELTPVQYTLSVSTSGWGAVILTPAEGVYDPGTIVTLEAIPAEGWRFTGWGGDLSGDSNPTTLTMDADKSVIANFEELSPAQYTLSVATSGSGSVVLNPSGGVYDAGTVVTLWAIPADGWKFTGWSGDLGGSSNPTTLAMDDNKNVTAKFVEDSRGGAGSAVAHEETLTGGSIETDAVSTFYSLSAAEGHLYVATITARRYRDAPVEVESVAGLGLGWQRLQTQCSGRGHANIEIWYALGNPNGDGVVTASLTGNVRSAVIAVSRYSGVDAANPIGAITSANTNGTGDTSCVDGTDSASYSANLATGAGESVVYSAVSIRRRSHTPGSGFTELAETLWGSGGGTAGIAVQAKGAAPFGNVTVAGSFDRAVDWALVSFEIRPGSG